MDKDLTIIYEENLDDEGTVTVTDVFFDGKELNFPDTIDGKRITGIDMFAFNSSSIKKIVIEHNVHLLPNCFSNCSALEEIDLSQSDLIELEPGLFSGLSDLKTVKLPDTLKTVKNLFDNCSDLKEIKFPKSCTRIDDPFVDCAVEKIYIDEAVEYLKLDSIIKQIEISPKNPNFAVENGFLIDKNTHKILGINSVQEKYIIPDSIEELDVKVFKGIKADTVDLNNVKRICSHCFEDADIKHLIAKNLLNTEDAAFARAKFKTIELPELTFLAPYLFQHASINKIELSDKCTTICEHAFESCDIKEFICPENLEIISVNAFAKSTLNNISFNPKLREIDERAFKDCLLNSKIILPKSLKLLGSEAFTYSPNSQYYIPYKTTYKNGIKFINKEQQNAKNIHLPVLLSEQKDFYKGTNLENANVSGKLTLEEILESYTIKESNIIMQSYER